MSDERSNPGRVHWIVPPLPSLTTFQLREREALERLGLDVHVVRPAVESLRVTQQLARHPLRAFSLLIELQRYKAPRDSERGRLGYLKLLLRGLSLAGRLGSGPERIHAVFADGVGTVAYVAHRLTGRPYSFAAHAPLSLWQRSRLLARQAQAADLVVAISEDVRDRLLEIAPSAHVEIVRCAGPNGAPEPAEPSTPFRVTCVGYLFAKKGFATALEGFALAAADTREIRLEIVGSGPEAERLRERAHALGIADRVDFVGATPIEDVLARLVGALVMLAPCEVLPDGDRDGLPVAILDAAACGVPSISTPVSGIPDFVLDGETGLIVQERAPDQIAAAIRKLAADPGLAVRLGLAARTLVARQHNADTEAERLTALWKECDANRGASRA